jgi:predicted GNAT family acetyltransferase
MQVTAHSDPATFAQLALPLLLRDEAMNCLPLGILDTLLNEPKRYPCFHLLSIDEGAETLGVAWMTPPYPLGLSPMPPRAVSALVEYATTLESGVPGVVGPRPVVDEFKTAWLACRGCSLRSTIEQRIYRLERVIPGTSVPGGMRVATESDRPCLQEWSEAFVRDCGLSDSRTSVQAAVAASVSAGNRVLWVCDGEPVAMAGYSGKTRSGIRVSWVYTPPERRRQGYAGALVEALSAQLLREGRQFCFLYTDLANPTSNAIYQRIGYEPVCDSALYSFA